MKRAHVNEIPVAMNMRFTSARRAVQSLAGALCGTLWRFNSRFKFVYSFDGAVAALSLKRERRP
jgi:hypothetical protein